MANWKITFRDSKTGDSDIWNYTDYKFSDPESAADALIDILKKRYDREFKLMDISNNENAFRISFFGRAFRDPDTYDAVCFVKLSNTEEKQLPDASDKKLTQRFIKRIKENI